MQNILVLPKKVLPPKGNLYRVRELWVLHMISCLKWVTQNTALATEILCDAWHYNWKLYLVMLLPSGRPRSRGKIILHWRQWEFCHCLRPGPGDHSRIFSQVIYHNFFLFCFYFDNFTVENPLCLFIYGILTYFYCL